MLSLISRLIASTLRGSSNNQPKDKFMQLISSNIDADVYVNISAQECLDIFLKQSLNAPSKLADIFNLGAITGI